MPIDPSLGYRLNDIRTDNAVHESLLADDPSDTLKSTSPLKRKENSGSLSNLQKLISEESSLSKSSIIKAKPSWPK